MPMLAGPLCLLQAQSLHCGGLVVLRTRLPCLHCRAACSTHFKPSPQVSGSTPALVGAHLGTAPTRDWRLLAAAGQLAGQAQASLPFL